MLGSTYIELPDKLKNPMKGLINVRNNENKFFLWCHIRHLNLVKTYPERITEVDKKGLMILIMNELNFLFQKRIIAELKDKIKFALMYSVMKRV